MADANRLTGSLDAVLHLLDRQVVDADGLLVCKVDDVELTVFDDGVLGSDRAAGRAGGAGAAVRRRRVRPRLHDYWRRLGTTQADRDDPYRIDLDLVERLGSAVELNVGRDGVLVRQGQRGSSAQRAAADAGAGPGRRAGWAGCSTSGWSARRRSPGERIRVIGLVVGHGRPGSYFGYDRRPDMGPWLVRVVVRWLHRHSAYVDAARTCVELDWDAGVVRVDPTQLQPLEAV